MSYRLILTLVVLAMTTLLMGCGGPTKAGIEARADARDRLAIVNAQVSYDQAKRAFEVGQFDRALREVRNALERYPDAAEYHLLHGRILLETHRLERALQAFDTAIEKNPESAEAHYFAGIIFQRWSNNERAFDKYMAASELDESNAQYLLAAAETMIALRRYSDARALVEPRMPYFEYNAALRHLLAQIAMLQGEPAFAASLFEQARMLNPDDAMLLEELAWAQYAAGRYGHCYESLKQLRQMSGFSSEQRSDLLHLEARCLMFLERHLDARSVYLELTRVAPTDPEVWIEFGALSWELADMRRVATSASRVIALAPDRFEGYLLRGVYSRSEGHLSDAARFFQQAIDRDPTQSISYLLLGQLNEQQGRSDAALAAYQKAVELSPNNSDAKALLAGLKRNRASAVAEVPVR